jgi:membrane associated rhomboid family serine protease
MLIPIGQENDTVRRVPWVTIAIMGLCLIIHIFMAGAISEFNASIMDSIAPGGGGGVAHWVHVWGFVFGAAGGLAIKFLKIEEKFVAPKVEAQTTYVNKSSVLYEEAMQVQQFSF